MANALDAILGVPAAIGGGALDILIGDRTNATAGEQAKRTIEALLFAGDNPGNLLALRKMNAREDAAKQSVIDTPDFRRTMEIQRTVKNLTPEEAFDATAKLYGISGYKPQMGLEAVDAAPGGPSLPDRQMVPQLAPLSRETQLNDIIQGTQLHAVTQGDPIDQLLARYRLGKVNPPMDVQRAAAADATRGADQIGLTSRTVQWKDGQLSVTMKELAPDEQFFADESRAKDAALFQNKYREAIGDPVRVGLAVNPSGGFSLIEMNDPEGAAAAGAAGRIRGETRGKDTPDTFGGTTPRQRETDVAIREAQRDYDTKVAPFLKLIDKMETNLKALPEKGGTIPGAIAGRGSAALGQLLPQAFPEQQALTSAGDAAAVMITDLYGGKGAQSDRDIKLMTGQVPRMGIDSQVTGRAKLAELRAAVQARRPGGAAASARQPVALPTNTIQTKSGRTIVYQE